MAKKTIIPGAYLPPRLVEAAQGWYIVHYLARPQKNGTIEWKPERKTYNLNRIADMQERRELANHIIQTLYKANKAAAKKIATESTNHTITCISLTSPLPIDESPLNALAFTPAIQAIDDGLRFVKADLPEESWAAYMTAHRKLLNFLDKKGWGKIPITQFTHAVAVAYMDAVCVGLSNRTWNNYKGFAAGIFLRLKERNYLEKNPFDGFHKKKNEDTTRRPFTEEEQGIVLAAAYEKNYWLFVIIMLHYMCLLRRTECYRLRFRNFDLGRGLIFLGKNDGKTSTRAQPVTIPNELIPYLNEKRFLENPQHYYLFGKGGKPHPDTKAGKNTYKRSHRDILITLHAETKLADITDLSLYSWKNTGMTKFAKILRPIQLRDHARHKSIEQSLQYYQEDELIKEVQTAKIAPKMKKPERENALRPTSK